MKHSIITAAFIFFLPIITFGQYSQTIRGTVIDKESHEPLVGAAVVLVGSNPLKGTITNEKGAFRIDEVSIGRHDIRVNYVGYYEGYVANIDVNSGKEVVLTIEMTEKITEKKEVVIIGTRPKDKSLNEMGVVSARMFTVEESQRFAGALGDPARMAANFAGVSASSDARNDIIIRGNSPAGLLWRLEGIDIPNPNHFASQGTTGGPVSILNNNLLTNSDFFTSAFPAEYGNALSGVFDLRMRNGNNEKYEFTGQVGFNGAEAMAEGPIKKSVGSSFLVSYRYSVLSFFQTLGINLGPAGVPRYQDLSFKINLPTAKAGQFEVFGVGGLSSIQVLESKKKPDNFSYGQNNRDIYFGSGMGVLGLSHTWTLGKKGYWKNIVATTYENHKVDVDSVADTRQAYPFYRENAAYYRSIWHSVLNRKFSASNTLKSGFIITRISYDSKQEVYRSLDEYWLKITSSAGNTWLGQAYIQWKHDFSPRFTFLSGVQFEYLFLNKTYSVEPRAGLRYSLNSKQSLSAGYGLEGQMQPLIQYFYETRDPLTGSYFQTNRNLGFTKAHHFVIGYDYLFAKDFRLKVETYYQQLFDVPVKGDIQNGFSMLNYGADFYLVLASNLANKGTGTNKGLDITVEKFFSNNYYFLFTGSIFDSKYKGSDGVEHNTAFNNRFNINLLAGKDFILSPRSTISASGKLTYAGGRYYTPVDLEKSKIVRQTVYDESKPFSQRFPDYFKIDARVGYKLNGKHVTQEWAFDCLNVTNRKNILTQVYEAKTNEVKDEFQLGVFPTLLYRIQF